MVCMLITQFQLCLDISSWEKLKVCCRCLLYKALQEAVLGGEFPVSFFVSCNIIKQHCRHVQVWKLLWVLFVTKIKITCHCDTTPVVMVLLIIWQCAQLLFYVRTICIWPCNSFQWPCYRLAHTMIWPSLEPIIQHDYGIRSLPAAAEKPSAL